jgi:hypothetical protein
MTKYLGTLIGQPIAAGGYVGASNFLKDGVDKVIMRDSAVIAAGGAIGDTVSLGVFRRNALLSQGSAFYFDALGAGVTVNIGSKAYPAALNSGLAVTGRGSAALLGGLACTLMFQPLWKMLGYPSDPNGVIELLATFQGAAPSAGGVAWQIHGYDHA